MVTLGRYEILGTLGEGGFATVYRARDTALGRQIALKVLLPHLAADPTIRQRFLTEASVIARLRHANIVTVYDVGEVGGQPYFTMELIEGHTLAALVRDGQGLPLSQVVHILTGLAAALDYLHAAGLVHRDIKAANVMLETSGRVVLMDFGIARALEGTGQTRTGAFVGTPEAMAPEQIRGERAGPAADVYALGVLTYQLLAGRPPFTGELYAVLHAHAASPPPPLRTLCPGLPKQVYAAVDAALAKEPARRPASAGELVEALRKAVASPRPALPPESAREPAPGGVRAPLIVALVTAFVVVVLGGAALVGFVLPRLSEDRAAPQPLGSELRLPGVEPRTLDPALVADADEVKYVVELFGGLVTLDRDLKVQPDIAREWAVSGDGTKYTFKLRDNVVFSGSGRRVTAQDVKYSLERAANRGTESPTAAVYLGDIVGVKDMMGGRANEIAGVKVSDDRTLEITLDAPRASFLAKLAHPVAFVVDKDQVEGDRRNWARRPNGTGPFQLQEWKQGERVVLVPHERYHGSPKPALRRVTFSLGRPTLAQYQNDQLDIITAGVVGVERFRDKDQPLSKELAQKPELATVHIAFNTRQPPFDDARVRQAFGMATDRQQIVDRLGGGVLAAQSILPPGMPGYKQDLPGLPFDPQRARQLLQESSYQGKLPPVVLTIGGQQGGDIPAHIRAIRDTWQQALGVAVEIQQVEPAAFQQDVLLGKYQLWYGVSSAQYPDPENLLDAQFHSAGAANQSGYTNPDVDRQLLQARTEQDQQKRLGIYSAIERQVLQDAPWIPLFHPNARLLLKPYVKGYERSEPGGYVLPTFGVPTLKYVSIKR